MTLNTDVHIRNEDLKRLSLLVALDMADISDDLATAEEETDSEGWEALRSEARDFLRSAGIYRDTLKALKLEGLNAAEMAEVDRLLEGVARIIAAGKSILDKAR